MKKKILLFLIPGLLFSLNAAQLRVHFDFEKADGDGFADKVSGLRAVAPKGVDLNRSLTLGPNGSAFRFEPRKNPLKIAHDPRIDLKDDFSLEFVFKTTVSRGFHCLFWKGDRSRTPEVVNYYCGIRDGRLEFKMKDAAGEWVLNNITGPPLKDGEWYHVILYWNQGRLKAVLNGTPCRIHTSDKEGKFRQLVSAPTDLYFGQGASATMTSFFFYGELDDFKIWKGDATAMKDLQWSKKKEKLAARLAEQSAAMTAKAAAEMKALMPAVSAACGGKPCGFALLPATRRIMSLRELFSGEFSRTASVDIAGNESESLQLFLFNAPGAANTVRKVTASDLRGPGGAVIPRSNITIGELGTVTTEMPDIPVDFIGPIPDVIRTGKTDGTIPADGIRTLVVRIFSGNASAGDYSGTLTVDVSGGELLIPVTVKVRNFSLPKRAAGYCNVLTFRKTPAQVLAYFLGKIRAAVESASQPVAVMTWVTLWQQAKQQEGFAAFWRETEDWTRKMLQEQHKTYPEVTLWLMQATLDFIHLDKPVVLLGFAPPYYPAVRSEDMRNAARFEKYKKAITALQKVKVDPYFPGVSDCSYCGLPAGTTANAWQANTPLWGDAYHFDMEALARLQIPFFLFGPWGKDLHQIGERVNRYSLTEEYPAVLEKLLRCVWLSK